MKDKIWLRIGKNNCGSYTYKIDKIKNLTSLNPSYSNALPTICIRISIEIPDKSFKEAQAEIKLQIKEAEQSNEIKVKEIKK